MGSAKRNENLGFCFVLGKSEKFGYKINPMADSTAAKDGTFQIRSEAHGPHWVAWVTNSADGAPDSGVLLVGQTQAEAEARARQWAERRR